MPMDVLACESIAKGAMEKAVRTWGRAVQDVQVALGVRDEDLVAVAPPRAAVDGLVGRQDINLFCCKTPRSNGF